MPHRLPPDLLEDFGNLLLKGGHEVPLSDNKGDASVQKLKRSWIGVLGAAALTVGIVAATAVPAMAYSPGTATPYKPTYKLAGDSYQYHCSFANWRSDAKVTWHCNLIERHLNRIGSLENVVVQKHQGNWTPGSTSYTTGTFSRKKVLGEAQLCVDAYALSVDGGTSNKKFACN